MAVLHYLDVHPGAFVAVVAVLGLVVGSFLNVVIHRLPRMLEREWRSECAEILGVGAPAAGDAETEPPERYDLVAPRSRCPHCGHAITALENVPVLSWMALRGRCSECGERISARYPAVETLSAVLAAVTAWHFGWSVQALGAVLVTWALIALAFIDLDTTYLPDGITLPFLWLGLLFNVPGTFVPLSEAVVGAAAGYGTLWLVYHAFRLATGKRGMGHGDFKLLAMLGAWMGWQLLPVVILLSSAVGAVVGVTLMLARGHDRNVPIPFGPYLAVAGWIALLWGDAITRAWLATPGVG